MHRFLGLIIIFIGLSSSAQVITTSQSDCANAIIFQDSITGNLTIPKGYGKKLEIYGHNIKNPYFFTKEHNTLWIKLVFTKNTRFEFQINPKNPSDDYDFSMFKINGPNYCDSIATNKVLPVRSNICRRKPGEGSITGLKEGYENLYAAAGNSPSFSAPLDVKKNEEYYLVLDGPHGIIEGFSIELKYNDVEDSIPEILREKSDSVTEEVLLPEIIYPNLKIQVLDDNSSHLNNADIKVKGIIETDSTYIDSSGLFTINRVRRNSIYQIAINAKGYKLERANYLSKLDFDTILTYKLEKLEIGSKLQFENIQFTGDEATILKSSMEDLENLTHFLRKNETIRVEIGGHVNAPKQNNKRSFKKLSKERAKAVYEYLITKGIDVKRMKYKGYGNSKMIFENPLSTKQSQANRRVEITILAL